jgi:hypothetical protein
MEEVGFGLSRIAWISKSQFWLDWNGLEWSKAVLARQEYLGMEAVDFSLTWPKPNNKQTFNKQNSKREKRKKERKKIG